MTCRAVRGAITVEKNSEGNILEATSELLREVISANQIKIEDIVSIFFTVTEDLNAQFPAVAARQLGWQNVPMLCSYEIAVKKSLKKCIRLLLTFNSEQAPKNIKHQYLRGAKKLRPDLTGE